MSALLKTSGIATSVLKAIWTKAKVGSKIAKGVMNKEEFEAACKLVLEAGGTFSSSKSAALEVDSADKGARNAVEESNV